MTPPTPPARGYAFQEELLYRAEAAGLRVVEHPITFTERRAGSSKLRWRDIAEFFATIVRLRHRHGALPRPNDSERHFALALAVALIFITGLPYLYGWLRTPPGHVYTGVHALASGDMAVYGSYIEQVRDGRWLFVDLFTSEWPQRPRFDIFWLAVGFFARLTHTSITLAFHLVRLILIIPFVLFLSRFVAAFLKPREKTSGFFFRFPIRTVRRTALLFLVFSSGLGTLIAESIAPLSDRRWRPGYDFWPPDLWVPESNTFLTLFQSPHLIVSLWLLLFAILATLRFTETRVYRWSIASGVTSLVLFQFHPFYVPSVATLLALWVVVESLATRRIRWDLVAHGLIIGIIGAPSVLYHLWNLATDPITMAVGEQNLLFTTDWWLVALGYGFLVPLAIIGVIQMVRTISKRTGSFAEARDDTNMNITYRLLLTWLVATIVLIYSPLTWQRRLIEGAHVVLVLIAMVGLFPLLSWLRPRAPNWLRRYAWGTVTAVIVAVPLFGLSTGANLVRDFVLYTMRFPRSIPRHAFYYPIPARNAMQWIRAHAPLGTATFTVGLDGNFLPMYAARQSVLGHGVATVRFVEKYRTTYALVSGEISLADARAFLDRERVRYILITDASRNLWTIDPAAIPGAMLAYRNSGAEVYRLTNDE